jgi:thiol-disulfide isomerase/thioredoxin
VKEIRSLLLSTLLLCFTLFSFTGCEDKKAQEPLIAVEDTTEIFTQKGKDQHKETQEALETKKEPIADESSASQTSTDTIALTDIQKKTHILTIKDQKIIFEYMDQSIVLLHFFSTWCIPCRGEIPYLADLQKKYKKDLFIAGILVNDVLYDHTLKEFISKYYAKYFISNSKQNDALFAKIIEDLHLPEDLSIPLTVIYKDGNYYTHYEGVVPVEMIDHDIQEAIKK